MPDIKTEAQKRAQKNYMSKFVRVAIRMTPEYRAIIQGHAKEQGESINSFIFRAINEQMKRDNTPAMQDVDHK